ncbi:MAG: hypothetical protein AB1792_08250 [Candidatus Zixiibacteriota bacterium]
MAPRARAKICWHPLSLQQLTPNKFARVVNSILAGQLSLLPGTLRDIGASSIDWRGYRETPRL